MIKLNDEVQIKEIMRKKRELKGRKEKILKDWTWRKRKMRWRLEEMAREEEKRDIRVWLG